MTGPDPRRFRLEPTIRILTRRRDGLLKRLQKAVPFVAGSVVLIARTCGNTEHCHCRTGRKHVNTFLTYKERGRTRTLYIPVDLEEDVRRWSAEYKKLKTLLAQISDLQKAIIRKHVKERRRHR